MAKKQSIFFTPGPSQLFPTVKQHIASALEENIPSISHRSVLFQEIFQTTTTNLRKLLNIPKDYHIFFLSSGTEAMERVIENCVQRYSYHFVNGAFSKRFYQTADELKKVPKAYEVPYGESFSYNDILIKKHRELICLTHNETSTGVMLNMNDVYKLKRTYPDRLFALDIVSSAPHADIDYTHLDCVFFSVQKGFGLPAGLGILVVSPQAIEKADFLKKSNVRISSYHSFQSLLKYAQRNQTPETPNVLALYLLNKISEDFLKLGIHKIRQQTVEKADMLYSFFDKHPTMQPFVKNKRDRSQTVIVVSIPNGSKQLIEALKQKGFVLGAGYGPLKETQIRIANFPSHSKADVKLLLSALATEAGSW